MHNNTMLDINLQLFDGAAAGAAAAGASGGEGAAEGGVGTTAKAEFKARGGSSRRSAKGETNVVYGIQGDDPGTGAATSPAAGENGEAVSKSGVSTTSDSLEAKRQAFEDLIAGEHKEQFTEKVQSIIDRRFKETKGMEKTIADQKPIMDLLMQRYGIADGDMSKLQTALEQDDKYYEDAAEEAGLTVEQFKAMQKLERENAELKLTQQRRLGEQQAQQQLAKWQMEGEEVKKIYPSFDLRTEIANREFQGLLKSGIPVQKAYELVHMDEIKEHAARAAAQQTGEQMKARMAAKAARPSENGTSSQSAVIVKNDVHSLSRADRAEVARRAQRGEKIRF